MIIELMDYKIRVIRAKRRKLSLLRQKLPKDLPGTVIQLRTSSASVIENYVYKNKLMELICGIENPIISNGLILVRWDNDVKQWVDLKEELHLISSNYPIFKSIWNNNSIPILRDFRPYYERKPVTIDKESLTKTFRKKSKPQYYDGMYGGNGYIIIDKEKLSKDVWDKQREDLVLEIPPDDNDVQIHEYKMTTRELSTTFFNTSNASASSFGDYGTLSNGWISTSYSGGRE